MNANALKVMFTETLRFSRFGEPSLCLSRLFSLRSFGASLRPSGTLATLGFPSRAQSLRPYGTCLFALLRRLRRIKKFPSLPTRPPALHRKPIPSPCLLRFARKPTLPLPRSSASLRFACLASYRSAPSERRSRLRSLLASLRGLLRELGACSLLAIHAVHATNFSVVPEKERDFFRNEL